MPRPEPPEAERSNNPEDDRINNWRKHREDQAQRAREWSVDPFSTGVLFPDWKERLDEPLQWRWRDTYDPLVVYRPATWLLREGWRKAGSVSFRAVPSRPLATARG
jgi:hypothetical protein